MNDDAFDLMSDWRSAFLNSISYLHSSILSHCQNWLTKIVPAYGISSHATMPFKGRWRFLQKYNLLSARVRVHTCVWPAAYLLGAGKLTSFRSSRYL